MTFTNEHERAISAALDAVYLQLKVLPYEMLIERFHQVGDRFAPLLEEPERTELRRRVAEGDLTAAMATRQAIGECQDRFEQLARLGWTNLEAKVVAVLSLSRHALDKRSKDIARPLLSATIDEVQRALSTNPDSQALAQYMHELQRLLAAARP